MATDTTDGISRSGLERFDLVFVALCVFAVPLSRSVQWTLEFFLMSSPLYDNPFVMANETGIVLASALAASVPTLLAVRVYDRRSAAVVGGIVLAGCIAVLLNMPPVLTS